MSTTNTCSKIWLETLRAEHAAELARSPLERGVVLAQTQTLRTCFAPGDGRLDVTDSSSVKGPVVQLPFDPRLPAPPTLEVAERSARTANIQTVVNWNSLEGRLTQFLANRSEFPEKPVSLADSRVVKLLTARWSKLGEADPLNLPFDEVAGLLKLPENHVSTLKQAGVSDLRGLGQALDAAEIIAKQNREIGRFVKELPSSRTPSAKKSAVKQRSYRPPAAEKPQMVEFPVEPAVATEIRRSIGEALQSLANGPRSRKG